MFPEFIARITFYFSVEIYLHISPNILQCFSYYSEQHKMRRVLIFFFSSFKKQKHRECFIFYVIFLHFFSFVNTNYRQLNCFPYLNKTLIIIFFLDSITFVYIVGSSRFFHYIGMKNPKVS